MEITARGVNPLAAECLQWLYVAGVEEQSRNGPVICSPEPMIVTHTHPQERVWFSPLRDANPFFHLHEFLWLIAGRDDVEWPAYFASNMRKYSDDGLVFWGSYGRRWRSWFGYDQIKLAVEELQANPESRRTVIQHWDGSQDLAKARAGGLDVPCNLSVMLDLRGGALNLATIARSHDVLYGALGANVVQFTCLQEYLAATLGVPVGKFIQFSLNYHVYIEVANREKVHALAVDASAHDLYAQGMKPFPLVSSSIEDWEADLKQFMYAPAMAHEYNDPFFNYVARPMYLAWTERKAKKGTGLDYAAKIIAPDWRRACCEWIERRTK
jgi:thymidylate synthase